MFHESMSRDHEDELATGQPQGIGSEAYLNGTSQEPIPEDSQKEAIFAVVASDSGHIQASKESGLELPKTAGQRMLHPGD